MFLSSREGVDSRAYHIGQSKLRTAIKFKTGVVVSSVLTELLYRKKWSK